jgi:rhodanese-related sulfurtransferase
MCDQNPPSTITLTQIALSQPHARTMSSAQKIVVFTATGEQGSSVCKYLVKEGYHVVGLTRNPESEKAKGNPTTLLDLYIYPDLGP